MRNTYYLKIPLVFFLVIFIGKSVSYTQNLCPEERISNGAFDTNLSNWMITPTSGGNNSWYHYSDGGNGTMYASGGGIATSNSVEICKNFTVSFKFKTWWGGLWSNAKIYVRLGNNLLVTLHSKATKDYVYPQTPVDYTIQTFVEGTDVVASYTYGEWHSVVLEVNDYPDTSLTELEFEYEHLGGIKGFYIDDVSVKNHQPNKPIPRETQLSYCVGDAADLTSVEPDPIPAGISYEWHTVASNPTNATKVANPSAVNAGTYYLYAKSNCETNCISESANVIVTENQLPNNTSSNGFKGGNICFGETAALTYNAENATFTTPHTIVYKKVGTTNTYTQVVDTASPFQFAPGDAPTTEGTHKYELIKITDGNGCVRTSGFGKKNAQIRIKGEVTCLITGNESPVCPKKTFTYSAPDNMNSYAWSVTGNATIQGASDTQNVAVLVGDSGSNFTLSLEVRSSGGCLKTCTKTLNVLDDKTPIFTNPANISLCVNNIINASYAETTSGDVNTPPDYYEFPTGYTDLDITNISDNCCSTNTITWTITPSSNGQNISGTGQPSATLAGKKLWLDVATSNPKASYTEKIYTITYKVTDCNSNESEEKHTTITITPRPKITKMN